MSTSTSIADADNIPLYSTKSCRCHMIICTVLPYINRTAARQMSCIYPVGCTVVLQPGCLLRSHSPLRSHTHERSLQDDCSNLLFTHQPACTPINHVARAPTSTYMTAATSMYTNTPCSASPATTCLIQPCSRQQGGTATSPNSKNQPRMLRTLSVLQHHTRTAFCQPEHYIFPKNE